MKNKLLTLAGSLGLLTLVGGYYAAPAVAQAVKAAIVQNRDAPARNAYQARANCASSGGYCQYQFPAVPAGKKLVIDNVSALLRGSTLNMDSVSLNGSNTGTYAFLPGTYMQPGGPFVINQPVDMEFEPGEAPFFGAVNSSAAAYTAVISIFGHTVDVP